jgi:7,8-dihydropterin-6-yl-methyl-4-(beta-D-ribofuranosyl)aminobenzene 5'-phosphate synthase
MQKTIEAFKTMEIQLIGVSHCTGEAGIKRIQREFPDKFIYNNTGNITKF